MTAPEDSWLTARSPSRIQQPIRAVSPRIRRNTEPDDLVLLCSLIFLTLATFCLLFWYIGFSSFNCFCYSVYYVYIHNFVLRSCLLYQSRDHHGQGEMTEVPTAGELLGRTHEELVLLLIQLRRRHAATHRAIEQCCLQITSIEVLIFLVLFWLAICLFLSCLSSCFFVQNFIACLVPTISTCTVSAGIRVRINAGHGSPLKTGNKIYT